MKPVKNWNDVRAAREREALPAGGYVVKIVGAKVQSYPASDGTYFDKLEIALDIIEGDHKGFYDADFRAQTGEDKKWRGVLRQYLPKDDGSEKDEWTKSSLKALIEAVEESNSGFHWDWDETKLKGKTVGCLFRLEEWSMDGKKGWKAQPFRFISAEKARKGAFTVPKFKAHRDHPSDTPDNYQTVAAVSAPAFEPIDGDDGDLPF